MLVGRGFETGELVERYRRLPSGRGRAYRWLGGDRSDDYQTAEETHTHEFFA